MLTNPRNRFSNSLLESILLFPVCQRHNFGIGSQQSVDFTLLRTQSLFITDNSGIRINLGNDFLRQISDGNLSLRCNVDLLSNRFIRFCNGNKACCRILDIIKVSGRCQGTKLDFLFSCQKLGNNGRNHGTRRLSWSKGIKWTDD